MNTGITILGVFCFGSFLSQLILIYEVQRDFKKLRNKIDSTEDQINKRMYIAEQRIRDNARETIKAKQSIIRLGKIILASY
jgi:hypothetical protein